MIAELFIKQEIEFKFVLFSSPQSLELKLEKLLGFRNMQEKLEKDFFFFFDAIGRQFTCMMSNQLLACWHRWLYLWWTLGGPYFEFSIKGAKYRLQPSEPQ